MDSDIDFLRLESRRLNPAGRAFNSTQARLRAIEYHKQIEREITEVRDERGRFVNFLRDQPREIIAPAPYALKGTDITP